MHVKLSKVLSDSVCLAIPAHFPDKFRRKLLQHYIVWHEKGEGNKVLNQTVGPEVTYLWLFRGLFFQVSAVFSYLYFLSLFSVTKTNLSVHEDKNRVPYVKVSQGVLC